jgi:hypothetical protein
MDTMDTIIQQIGRGAKGNPKGLNIVNKQHIMGWPPHPNCLL